MSDKPSYLSLLNAIALNEARAHRYLQAWIEKTDDPEVKAVLQKVSWREGEHGMSFAKRLNELGYEVRDKGEYITEERYTIATSDLSDREKIERLGLHELDKLLEYFDTMFSDHTIDIETGELLGRYVAEEFDSAKLLRSCWEQLCARDGVGSVALDS
jgi:Mn-containing catalase